MRRGLLPADLDQTEGDYFETYDGDGDPLYLFRPEGSCETIDVTLVHLAAKRDKKGDIAALTLNMAISVASRQAADHAPQCLNCGALVVIGTETADCPVCRTSWPVVASTTAVDVEAPATPQ